MPGTFFRTRVVLREHVGWMEGPEGSGPSNFFAQILKRAYNNAYDRTTNNHIHAVDHRQRGFSHGKVQRQPWRDKKRADTKPGHKPATRVTMPDI